MPRAALLALAVAVAVTGVGASAAGLGIAPVTLAAGQAPVPHCAGPADVAYSIEGSDVVGVTLTLPAACEGGRLSVVIVDATGEPLRTADDDGAVIDTVVGLHRAVAPTPRKTVAGVELMVVGP